MQTGRLKWASGILLSLLLAPPAAADLLNFTYTGGVQTFTAPVDGLYQIIADGASGGNSTSGGPDRRTTPRSAAHLRLPPAKF